MAGKREGLAGERSGLWWEFHRIIGELAPTWVLIENVPGLLSSNEGRDMAVVVRGLEELGYGWSYRILDSQYFGVAQRRRRVFIVGRAGGFCPPEILLEPESVFGDSPPSRKARESVAGSPGCRSANTFRYQNADTPLIEDSVSASLKAEGATTDERSVGAYVVAHPVTAREGKGPNSDCDSGNLVVDTPMLVTATAVPRRLTPTECERLQAFPDCWTEWGVDGNGERVEMADGPRYRMLGNAVTVNVSEWIGRRIMEHAERGASE